MAELLSQLGIEGDLLLSQGVNFLIVLGVLTWLVYKPLLKILKERREKIELGVKAGEEAEVRLAEIDELKTKKLAEADQNAAEIVKRSEGEAKVRGDKIVVEAHHKSEEIIRQAHETAENQEKEALKALDEKAAELVKQALIETVKLSPEAVDENLIREAISNVKQ